MPPSRQQQQPQPQHAGGTLLPAPDPPPADGGAGAGAYARAAGAYTQREEHLQRMEAAGEIRFAYVVNDGSPQNMIWLIGLKNVFSRQLPNMPKEYIARLVLNRHHRSVALISYRTSGGGGGGGSHTSNSNAAAAAPPPPAGAGAVVGGITYRVFPAAPAALGEIAFCAVAAAEQVKGFGTRLMNRAKAAARDRDGLTHLLTYADNNAVGYFGKQGFTRAITLPREAWLGYIKDYDGGTLMECALHPKLPYDDLPGMLRAQKAALDAAVRGLSSAHVVRDAPARASKPLPADSAHPQHREALAPLSPLAVPGVKAAGYTAAAAYKPKYRVLLDGAAQPAAPTAANVNALMDAALAFLTAHADAWPFQAPVDRRDAPDYYDVVRDPVDLSLVKCRLGTRSYYLTLDMFVADVRRMLANCRYYNTPATIYHQAAVKLEAALDAYLADRLVYDDAGDDDE